MDNNLMQMIVNWGTLLTAIVSLLTLLEMRKQRLVSMQPDVVLTNFDFLYLYYRPEMKLYVCWPFLWSKQHLENASEEPHHIPPCAFQLHLKNIGSGTAKSLTYRWDYDVETLVTHLSKLDLNIEFTFDRSFEGNMRLLQKSPLFSSLSSIPGINKSGERTYYLSIGEDCNIPFCESYSQFISLWFYGKLTQNNSTFDDFKKIIDEFESFSPLKLTLQYSDLSGNKYKKDFEFQLIISMLSKAEVSFSVNIMSA